MNPFKEIASLASRIFSDECEPVLGRVRTELRDMLYDAQPGRFGNTVEAVNALLERDGERGLTHREIDDAEQINYLRIHLKRER